MIRKLAFASAAVVLLGAGCAGGGATDAAETVSLKLIAFKPERLEVEAGSAVKWRNDDGTAHTVTSGSVVQEGGSVKAMPDGRFDSGELAAGRQFSFTLQSPGTYTYYCRLHPATMRGEIVVK